MDKDGATKSVATLMLLIFCFSAIAVIYTLIK
jgi:hypothetical protein